MNQNQINVDDNLKVTFTAAEILQVINHLRKGSYDFVADPIGFLNNRILEAHSALERMHIEPPPSGGIAGTLNLKKQ